MQITPEKWIESNRTSLMVLAEFINNIPDPMTVHRQIPIGECVITAEAFDPNHHLTHPKLIVTQVFVVHAGRMTYRGEDCLVQIMFPTTAGLVAMYLNLTHYFWRLVTPGMAPYLESLATKISEANQLPLDEMGVFDSYIMTKRVMTTPPPHLMSLPLDKTVVMTRELDGTVFGLEVARLTSTSNAYHVSTITVTQTSEVDKIMSVLADAQIAFNSRSREWALNQDAQDNNPCSKLYTITDAIQDRLTATMGLVMYRVFVTQDSDNRGLKLSVSPMVTDALPMIEASIQAALADLRTHDNLDCNAQVNTLSNMVVAALRLDTLATPGVSEACLECSRLEPVRDQPAAHPVQVKLPPAPRPDPTIDTAMLAIVKTIEECLQIDLGRALYTLELNLKAPLKRTMTITTPDTRTLIAVTESIYSTCVKMGKDRKHGCSVTMSQFAHSVVVTITPTDRVIHI